MTTSTAARLTRRLRPYAPQLAIAAAAIAIAATFAATVLRHTPAFGLPLDDAYIYLTYAKQAGRGQPFTYFPGGGYSAGATSVLWPLLLAPFWALGARGHALVWVSFGLCTLLYAATCVGLYAIVRALADRVAGLVAAAMALAIGTFAWTALSGMEAALASALLVATVLLLLRAPHAGPPGMLLAACLAATALSRPEATLIVVGVIAVAILHRLRQRDLRAALLWAAPLAAPLAWVTANKLLAGHWFPNTGVAKSHFYQPGFDWPYWLDAVITQTGLLARRLFWQVTSPLVWPTLMAVLWLIGAIRLVRWARAHQRVAVGLLILGAPFALMLAVIASSGAWEFHNYRYIAAAFPLLLIPVGCALAPFARASTPGARAAWIARVRGPALVVLVALFWRAARPELAEDIALYAQTVSDLHRQHVTLGKHIHRELPDASIMLHDAGAVAYYGDTRVNDLLGLVTNGQAQVATHGPGARFELLERLPPERQPTHFVYYPGWMGQLEFFGRVLRNTPLGRPFHERRLIGGGDLQLIEATWDHVHTAERPLTTPPGWHMVDRVDVADLASEAAHGWRGALGRRKLEDPAARWSVVHREVGASGLLLDGGRTIRGGSERFTISVEPGKPVRVVLRTGGKRGYAWNEELTAPVELTLWSSSGALGRAVLPVPPGRLVEVSFELPAAPDERALTLWTQAAAPYRAFHWFVLQPE